MRKVTEIVAVFGNYPEIHSRQMHVCEEEEEGDNLPYPEGDQRMYTQGRHRHTRAEHVRFVTYHDEADVVT